MQEIKPMERGTSFKMIGPYPNAILHVMNKFQLESVDSIPDVAKNYLAGLKHVNDIESGDFLALFWAVDDKGRESFLDWISGHGDQYEEIDFGNRVILNHFLYGCGIKGYIFAEDLDIVGDYDVMKINLNNPVEKKSYDDLAYIFQFLVKDETSVYLNIENPEPPDLAQAIVDWKQNKKTKEICRVISDHISSPTENYILNDDDKISETDKVALYYSLRNQMQARWIMEIRDRAAQSSQDK